VEREARTALRLPDAVSSPADVGRLLQEITAVDEAILQHKLRKSESGLPLPATSRLMEKLIELNNLNLLQAADRQLLSRFLTAIKTKAPVLHVSFAADPSPDFMGKLAARLRQDVHPYALMTIGLQPNIGAGCMLRTTNKYFDFTLRNKFKSQRSLLLDKIAGMKSP
jgi:F0F1-type ATP synthase delta subunit